MSNAQTGESQNEELFDSANHIVTQEDLDANPDWAEQDIKVGDEVVIPSEETEIDQVEDQALIKPTDPLPEVESVNKAFTRLPEWARGPGSESVTDHEVDELLKPAAPVKVRRG